MYVVFRVLTCFALLVNGPLCGARRRKQNDDMFILSCSLPYDRDAQDGYGAV